MQSKEKGKKKTGDTTKNGAGVKFPRVVLIVLGQLGLSTGVSFSLPLTV